VAVPCFHERIECFSVLHESVHNKVDFGQICLDLAHVQKHSVGNCTLIIRVWDDLPDGSILHLDHTYYGEIQAAHEHDEHASRTYQKWRTPCSGHPRRHRGENSDEEDTGQTTPDKQMREIGRSLMQPEPGVCLLGLFLFVALDGFSRKWLNCQPA